MSITFHCANCGRTLTTSEDRAGQQAKCPGCGEVVTVPTPVAPADIAEVLAPTDDADEHLEAAEDSAARQSPATKACPMCGMENPRKARKCQGCGEAFPGHPKRDRRASTSLDLGNVLSATWDIFTENFALAVGSSLIYMILSGIWVASIVIPLYVTIIMIDQKQEPPLALFVVPIPFAVLSYFAMIYLAPGYTLLLLGIARGEDVSLGTLFSGGKYVIRYFLASIIFSMAFGFGLMLCVVPGIFLALIWWAYSLVLVDEDAPGISCLSRSKELMDGHWGQVFLIGLIGALINQAAGSFCCILQLFTQAFMALLMAVTYVRLSGQLTARERPFAQEDDAGIDE